MAVRLIRNAILALVCCVAWQTRAAHTQCRLILAAETARPGDTVLAGIQLRMDPGWHTYWTNSGASGLPTTIEWDLPAGVTAGNFAWPVPEKVLEEDVPTYIYSNEVVALVQLKLATDLKPGPVQLQAKVAWLECEVQCVRADASVEASLNIGSQTVSAKEAESLSQWQKRLPGSASQLAAKARWEKPAGGSLRPLILEWTSKTPSGVKDFFPGNSQTFEVQGGVDMLSQADGKVQIRKQVKKLEGDWPKEIFGLIVEGSAPQRVGYEVTLPVEASVAGIPTPVITAPSGASAGSSPLWLALLYAFAGGLILNVMPCVLPVIALKILGFVNQAKDDPSRVRKYGLIYTLGVLVSFLVLAAVVIGVKAAGNSIGWGFQFSNPYFLVFMTALVTLVALNLFGVFEVTLSGRALNAASTLASEHGAAGTFFNGLLATVLATSCSAPILGSAIGFAFARPPIVILLIMLTVGLGLAAPYLVLSWKPSWLKVLPKPGAWMERFKIAMGFPMLGAAIWLCSLLTIHYGERAWWMAVFLVFLAVAAWVYGEFVQRNQNHRWLGGVCAAILLVGGYAYALQNQMRLGDPVQETAQSELPREAPRGIAWMPWSAEAVAEARTQGRPVIVDFTAKWCPTCNTVVKPTLENPSVQRKLKEINAVPLLANYTRQPPAMTAELRRFNRAGVPLVLVYPRDPQAPPVAFDLVTPGTLTQALVDAAK